MRSARVKCDLEYLMDLHPTDLEVVLSMYPGDKVAEFCTHIRKAVHEKPWTLVSYAWCFYMAVFSGGRWIRAGLLKAGPDFWQACKENEKSSVLNLPERGLSLWHFPGQFDGEDIKLEFKAQLAAAETLFTDDQRVDIIEEAKNIFALCATLVEELDDMVGSENAPAISQKKDVEVTKALAVEKSGLKTEAEIGSRPTDAISSSRVMRFVRRPEVTGGLVALGCFACVALLRFQ
jgi:heme oxygenase